MDERMLGTRVFLTIEVIIKQIKNTLWSWLTLPPISLPCLPMLPHTPHALWGSLISEKEQTGLGSLPS